MATQSIQSEAIVSEAPQQGVAGVIAFRFAFVYFGLYCILTQVLISLVTFPTDDVSDLSRHLPIRLLISWVAVHVLRVGKPPNYVDTGSGDTMFDWTVLFCLLVFAALATAIWTAIDRKRRPYTQLKKWFRVFIRFCLAGQMIVYGFSKAVPLQMPFPNLTRLLEPFGNLSPMGVLWASIGASPAYETFAGCAELLGGILLIFPRTTMLGALICLADLTQVFMLNMTYDVPVKLLSFHLILLSLYLLAHDFQRLAGFFFGDRATEPSAQPQLFSTRRANRIALAVQILFGLWLLGINSQASYSFWYKYGGARPKSALYGIWDVDQMAVDGQIRSPLLNDYGRWRRVIFDYPERVGFARMDDSWVGYGVKIDTKVNTLALTKNDDKNWKASFTYVRDADDRLTLDGEMDGHKTRLELHKFDLNKFRLVSRGFHWVQEAPFNR